MRNYLHYITLILGVIAIELFPVDWPTVRLIIGLAYLGSLGISYAHLLGFERKIEIKLVLGLVMPLSMIIIAGSALFYFYRLNDLFFAIITLILPILPLFVSRQIVACTNKSNILSSLLGRWSDVAPSTQQGNWKTSSLIFIYLLFFVVLLATLVASGTTQVIRTPWTVVSPDFFIIFLISTGILILILLQKEITAKINYKLFLLIAHFFIVTSVVLFVYRLGYGFDPFIHRATLKIIWESGTVSPKPFYYIGQYSLIFYLAKLLGLSIDFLDKILTPVLATIFLPITFYCYFKKQQKLKIGNSALGSWSDVAPTTQGTFSRENNFFWLMILSCLLLTANLFIATTPQSLANLFLFILLFWSLIYAKESIKTKIIIFGPVLAALFLIHPIVGIPAGIFFILYLLAAKKLALTPELVEGASWGNQPPLAPPLKLKATRGRQAQGLYIGVIKHFLKNILSKIFHRTNSTKLFSYLYWLVALISLLILPLIWLLISKISNQAKVTLQFNFLNSLNNFLADWQLGTFANDLPFNAILRLIYFFYFNLSLILLIIFLVTFYYLYKTKQWQKYLPYLTASLILFLNYLFLRWFLNFDFLINYERQNYSDRLLTTAVLILLPVWLDFILLFWLKISRAKFLLKLTAVIGLALALTANLYLSYPRLDNFSSNHGFSVSQADLDAVHYIAKIAGKDYIVLANQQTSAAALQEFGFKKHYQTNQGELFYYPIPTGGPLYQYYLDMVNNGPSRLTMNKALKLAGVKEGYLVINKYWWQSGKLVQEAKLIADDFVSLDNGEIWVFKFSSNSNSNCF